MIKSKLSSLEVWTKSDLQGINLSEVSIHIIGEKVILGAHRQGGFMINRSELGLLLHELLPIYLEQASEHDIANLFLNIHDNHQLKQ